MAGKHRKPRRRKSAAPRRWLPSLAAAAVTATSLTMALTTGTTTIVASPAVELTATVTPASSTAQIFASPTFYGVDFTDIYGDQKVVPFFLGPQAIVTSIRRNAGEDNVVLSSGWGAGQTGTALARLEGDDALNDVKLVILDNNTNRAGGGFWTTYWIFAPLLLTSAQPTPNDLLDVEILDVGYEYNINGNAPTYPINLLALANSLVAYVYTYAGQSDVELPADLQAEISRDPDDPSGPPDLPGGTHYIVEPAHPENPTIIGDLDTKNITYVTFKSDRLPLVKPLLLIPGGKLVADAVEPVLTVLVNAGYKDNEPIPDDPSVPRPMGLIPLKETITALHQLPGAVRQGIENDRLARARRVHARHQPSHASRSQFRPASGVFGSRVGCAEHDGDRRTQRRQGTGRDEAVAAVVARTGTSTGPRPQVRRSSASAWATAATAIPACSIEHAGHARHLGAPVGPGHRLGADRRTGRDVGPAHRQLVEGQPHERGIVRRLRSRRSRRPCRSDGHHATRVAPGTRPVSRCSGPPPRRR